MELGTIELAFRLKCFLDLTGLLNPKSSGKYHVPGIYFCVILDVYLGHGSFHPMDVFGFSAKKMF